MLAACCLLRRTSGSNKQSALCGRLKTWIKATTPAQVTTLRLRASTSSRILSSKRFVKRPTAHKTRARPSERFSNTLTMKATEPLTVRSSQKLSRRSVATSTKRRLMLFSKSTTPTALVRLTSKNFQGGWPAEVLAIILTLKTSSKLFAPLQRTALIKSEPSSE